MVSSPMTERAIGAVVGSACGDALGAPYEFKASLPDDVAVTLKAGHPWSLGEWTDDTAMAVPILEALAKRRSPADPATLNGILERWVEWSRTAKDIGIQTSAVLAGLQATTEEAALASSKRVHDERGRSGGNGSLMRTGPLALGYLDDPNGLAEAARRVSELTHFDPDAGDACVIWSLAVRHAIVTGELDVRSGVDALPEERQTRWHALLDEAETHHPRHYEQQSGWVVGALQAAWAAIHGATGYVEAVERAVRVGNDTDTVAAIAGALAGARWGYSSIPWAWRRHLHGWPGLGGDDLVALSRRAVNARLGASDGAPRSAGGATAAGSPPAGPK